MPNRDRLYRDRPKVLAHRLQSNISRKRRVPGPPTLFQDRTAPAPGASGERQMEKQVYTLENAGCDGGLPYPVQLSWLFPSDSASPRTVTLS